MRLPQFQDGENAFQMFQNVWGGMINPVINNPLNNVSVLKSVSLSSGDNTINHLLGRKLQGWFIVRQRGAASFYDKQDSNQLQDLTLVLNSSAAVVVDIAVY